MTLLNFLGGPYDILILAIVALVLFGGSKLAGFGKNAGKAIREFKEETGKMEPKKEGDAALEGAPVDATAQTVSTPQPTTPNPAGQTADIAEAEIVEHKPENQA